MVKFDNSWMSLHVASMGKIQKVENLQHIEDNITKGFVQVAELNGRPVMSKLHPAPSIENAKIKSKSKTGFYIETDGKFFGVSLVTDCQKTANKHMLNDENSALIATDSEGFVYIAELSAANEK